jgi:hypothetical protein
MMALDALYSAVPLEMVLTIAKKDMAKEAWDMIATMRVGDDHVKKVMTLELRQKIDLATFDDSEIIEDYALHLSSMAVHLSTLYEEVCFDPCLLASNKSQSRHYLMCRLCLLQI